MTHIHFICRGNVYRSRLAEAYAKSLLPESSDIILSSSGIQAELNLSGDVDPATVEALEADNIKRHLVPMWQQTSQKILNEADLIVFMSDTVYEDANKHYDVEPSKSIVWHIQDVDNIYPQVKLEVDKLMKSYKLN